MALHGEYSPPLDTPQQAAGAHAAGAHTAGAHTAGAHTAGAGPVPRGAAPGPRLPLILKMGYGLGQALEGAVSQSLNVFVLFYLTAVCGLPGGAAGAALSLGLVVDAVADPMIGAVSDGWRSAWGRRLPFMAVAWVPSGAAFVALFSLPHRLHGAALVAYVVALSALLRVSVSLFNLPYQALGAEIADGHAERMSIAAWRWAAGMAGGLVCIALGFGVFLSGPEGLLHRAAYTPFAIACVLVMGVAAGAAMAAGRALQRRAHFIPPGRSAQQAGFFRQLRELAANPSFRAIFISALFFFVCLGTSLSLGLHANHFFWGLNTKQVQLVTLSTFAGLLVGAPCTTHLAAMLEKRTAMLIGTAGFMAALVVLPSARLLGLLPMQGAPLAALLAAVALAGGIMLSMTGVSFAAMMADAADEHEFLFHARREALYFAGWSFAGKTAIGIGALLAGLALQLIGFPHDLAAVGGLNAHLSPSTVRGLGLCAGPGAGLIGAGSFIAIMGYKVDRARHRMIMSVLRARRPG